jgi:acetylornithine deacetylase
MTTPAPTPAPDAPLDPALAADILAAVEAGFDDQVGFLEELVRFPTVRGQEHTAQDFMAEALAARGYAIDRWTIDVEDIRHHPGFSPVTVDYSHALNVVGSHRPRETRGRSLILNGHMDVVPTGPATMWASPPFVPRREGDWLYGRGAGDMKAGLSANLFAVDALRRLGFQPAATLYQQSVVEEECTGNGALACLTRGYRADAAIIPEPEDDRLVRANVGVIWFQVTVKGKPAHVREAGLGANAIEAAFRLIQGLRGLEADWNARKGEHPHFAHLEQPITFNPGKIKGGDWASSVPSWCTFDARIGLYPGVDARDAAREIEDTLRRLAAEDAFLSNNPPEVTYNGFMAEGYVLEEGSLAEKTLGHAHATAHRAALEAFTTTSYLDGRVFVLYQDTPCLVYGPVAEAIHGIDERVSLASVKRVTGTIALFIAAWCGLERA